MRDVVLRSDELWLRWLELLWQFKLLQLRSSGLRQLQRRQFLWRWLWNELGMWQLQPDLLDLRLALWG